MFYTIKEAKKGYALILRLNLTTKKQTYYVFLFISEKWPNYFWIIGVYSPLQTLLLFPATGRNL